MKQAGSKRGTLFSQELLEAGRPLWDDFLAHPFVTGIRDGSLDVEKFKFYMIQDYLYLVEYARVFALGAAKAPDVRTMRYFADYENRILNTEMETHRSYMLRLGIKPEKAEKADAAPENQAYTDFMLARSWEGTAADIVITVMACAESYEYIAREMVRVRPESLEDPFFGEWIGGYASDDYASGDRELEQLVDLLTEGLRPAERERYLRVYLTCTRCEKAFWDMGWRGHL